MDASDISFDLAVEEIDADAERLDDLTVQLMRELRDYGVDSIKRRSGGLLPEGAKGDPFTVGALSLVAVPAILTGLFGFLQAWMLRGDGRKVRIQTTAGIVIEFVPEKRFSESEILALVRQLTAGESTVDQAQEEPSQAASPKEDPRPVRYVDFDLHVAPNGYAFSRSLLAGEARAKIPLAMPNAIEEGIKLIKARQTTQELLVQVGEGLYNWLFPGPIHTHLQQTEAVARQENQKLRLRLRIEPEAIGRLPLELLYRKTDGTFMAINPNTVISRYLNLPKPPGRVRRRAGPLQLLVIISDPADLTRLPPDEWEAIIYDALGTQIDAGLLVTEIVKKATRKEIRNALLHREPDIIQFIGHGIFKDGRGYLALVDEDTEATWRVNDEQFANLFLGHNDALGLISLATCESAASDDPQGFVGIAPKLVQRGVPAVLSMQYKVYIDTAKTFLEEFYTQISARKPIDWAVQAARNAISLEAGLDNREFATPVLYMRAEDGNLF